MQLKISHCLVHLKGHDAYGSVEGGLLHFAFIEPGKNGAIPQDNSLGIAWLYSFLFVTGGTNVATGIFSFFFSAPALLLE